MVTAHTSSDGAEVDGRRHARHSSAQHPSISPSLLNHRQTMLPVLGGSFGAGPISQLTGALDEVAAEDDLCLIGWDPQ